MSGLSKKTIFITGASRGIGREIALRCARDGANVVITGKTAEAHAKLSGTVHSVAAEVEQAGGVLWQFRWMCVMSRRYKLRSSRRRNILGD